MDAVAVAAVELEVVSAASPAPDLVQLSPRIFLLVSFRSPITSLPSSSSHAMGMGSTKIFRTRVKHKASSSEERER